MAKVNSTDDKLSPSFDSRILLLSTTHFGLATPVLNIQREKTALECEIEALKTMSTALPKTSSKKANDEQIRLDEIAEVEAPVEEANVTMDETPAAVAPEAVENVEEAPTADKPTVKLKKKKVRAMFDAISFDDI